MDPQDIYLQCVNAKKQNKKIVLYTIYGLYTEYEQKARGGFAQKIANFLSPYQIGYLKNAIRHYHENRFHKGVIRMMFRGYYGLMKDITKSVDVFLPNSISAIYCYYDHEYSDLSIGKFSILAQIKIAKELNIPYIYLGYWIKNHFSMGYKETYSPFEILDNRASLSEMPLWKKNEK